MLRCAVTMVALLLSTTAPAQSPPASPGATTPAAGTAPRPSTAGTASGTPAPNPAAQRGPATIDADSIDGTGGIEVRARGRAELKRDDTTVFSESLRYNRETGVVEADGGVRLERAGDRFNGTSLRYDSSSDTGRFIEPSFTIRRDETTRGRAKELEFLSRDRFRLFDAAFTTCQPDKEDWIVEADEIELDYEAEEAKVRNARLRFLDSTILALPYGTFPLEKRRKSGFLRPHFGQSSLRGLEVAVPYYWNISPEQDLTVTPNLMSRRGLQLKGEYRYLDRDYSGTLNLEGMEHDRVRDRSRFGFALQHRQLLMPNLLLQADVNKVSDDRYFSDLSSQVRQVSTGNLPRDVFMQYSGALAGQAYSLQARVQRFQTLQDPVTPIAIPYHRVPQINLNAARNDVGGLFDIGLPAEYTRFSHPTRVEGGRLVLNPTLSAPLVTPGWFVTPRLGLRHASYDLSNTAPGAQTRPAVNVPWASLDAGLTFERPDRWFGQDIKQTLEPRAYYVKAAYRDQSAAPVFDSALADFSYAQIFSENRFAGGDRFGDANQLTLAVTSRVLTDAGVEAFRATIGQRYYFEDERVRLNAASPLRTYRDSDILSSVGGRLGPDWSVDAGVQFNPRGARFERYSAAVRYSPEIAKVIGASYRFNRDALRQVDLTGQWPVAAGWYAVGRLNYSIRDRLLLNGIAGIEYNGGCWVFRVTAQRLQTSSTNSSTTVLFQLELAGFGSIGSDEIVGFLRRNVPGYSVTNPADHTLVPSGLRRQLPFQQIY